MQPGRVPDATWMHSRCEFLRDKDNLKTLIYVRHILLSIVEGGGPKAQGPACSQQATENPLGDPTNIGFRGSI
uniref:Uncharacterized protein n=1 Tax=Romanomermis culicivorax TaxID=13658 RepID=A0A915JAV0_ROMCU